MKHLKVNRTELTPVSFLVRSADVFPDKAAVVHGSRRYTYRQLAERVNRLASALRAVGLQKHDRVAFICPNIPPMLEAHYGVPAAGGILVAINTRLSSDEIGYILQHSGSKFLFVDAELEGLIKPLELGDMKVVRVDDTGAAGDPYEDFLAGGSPEPVESWLESEDETILLWHRGLSLSDIALGHAMLEKAARLGIGYDSLRQLRPSVRPHTVTEKRLSACARKARKASR